MKKEMVLYEKVETEKGCLTLLVGVAILIIMLIADGVCNFEHEEQFICLSIILPVIGGVFTFILIRINENNPQELLSISEKGLHDHFKDSQISWEKISEIQIIDNVISVTVDTEPEKDFKLQLYSTDFYKHQMTIDEFVKLINCYYKKNIYTYTSPPSCGCC